MSITGRLKAAHLLLFSPPTTPASVASPVVGGRDSA